MLIQCWSTVYDGCPTFNQNRTNVLCLLGMHNSCMDISVVGVVRWRLMTVGLILGQHCRQWTDCGLCLLGRDFWMLSQSNVDRQINCGWALEQHMNWWPNFTDKMTQLYAQPHSTVHYTVHYSMVHQYDVGLLLAHRMHRWHAITHILADSVRPPQDWTNEFFLNSVIVPSSQILSQILPAQTSCVDFY